MAEERYKAELSVSILLTHGRSNRLFMTRHGVLNGEEPTWGLIAGAIDESDNDPWKAALREAGEEANINSKNIIFVRGRNPMEPHAVMIRGPGKNFGGFVFDATYSGPKVPINGYIIEGDEKVDRVELFSYRRVLGLLDGEEKIYRPDFNEAQLMRWLLRGYGETQKRKGEVDSWMGRHVGKIDGLYPDAKGGFEYIPPYNQWMMMPGIRGNPKRTNFARERYTRR